MSSAPIQAVVFDADGLVIHPWRFASTLEGIGITRQATRPFFEGIFNECLLGRRDLKAVLPPFLAEWNWTGGVDSFVDLWLRIENAPDERVVNTICRLRQAGCLCALATLQEPHRAAYMRHEMGFTRLFDYLFFSCEIGHTKQEAAFYQHATQTMRLAPAEILFWDDSPANVEAARRFGWQAEIYTDFETLAAYFQAHSE